MPHLMRTAAIASASNNAAEPKALANKRDAPYRALACEAQGTVMWISFDGALTPHAFRAFMRT